MNAVNQIIVPRNPSRFQAKLLFYKVTVSNPDSGTMHQAGELHRDRLLKLRSFIDRRNVVLVIEMNGEISI